ncbi:hypothetical protein [Blastochloris tepida]|uniref:DUF2946 domain-containing protein n=1 Tax=Blastochloris tepida TaxID=2233851 RepID=A0A348FX76_9HYPH|nr:hypothetical protein [Blastochloris tepida]BBF91909.1 hypothetical protein BLTE_05940 [Blastochloris tepida]
MLKLMAVLFAGLLLAVVVVAAAPAGVADCHAAGAAAHAAPHPTPSPPVLPDQSTPDQSLPDQSPAGQSPTEHTAPCFGLGGCGLCGIKLPDEPAAIPAERLVARIDAGSERDPGALAARPPTPPPRG